MKKIILITLLAITVLMIGGCGGKGTTTPIIPPVVDPVVPPATFDWQGIIAFNDYHSDSQNWTLGTYFLTPQGNKKISSFSNRYRPNKWSPNGQYFAMEVNNIGYLEPGTNENKLLFFDRAGNLLKSFDNPDFYCDSTWTPDSTAILAGIYRDGLYKFSVAGQKQKLIAAEMNHHVVFSQDGVYAYYLSHSWGVQCELRQIKTTDLLSGNENYTRILNLETQFNEDITLSQIDDTNWLIGYTDRSTTPEKFIFGNLNMSTGQITTLHTFTTGKADQIAISPDKQHIALLNSSTIWNSDIKLVDMRFNQIKTFTGPINTSGHNADIHGLTWSPDGKMIAMYYNHYDNKTMYYRVAIIRVSDGAQQIIYETTKKFDLSSYTRNNLTRNGAWYPYNNPEINLAWTY